jgi:predicted Zn-dependent peptidase
MDVHQGKLCMGFLTPVTIRDEQFVAMQMMNLVFGGGVTGKLFMVLREQMSLCYAIGSAYHGSKGILTVSAGIDSAQEANVRARVLEQLDACQKGRITQDELISAREALISSLRTVHDSPGAMENYYASAVQSGLKLTVQEYMDAAASVTIEQIAEVAKQLRLHTVFFLKGVQV